jgi:hypothetical protein
VSTVILAVNYEVRPGEELKFNSTPGSCVASCAAAHINALLSDIRGICATWRWRLVGVVLNSH